MNSTDAARLADQILDVLPASMRKIRAEVRLEAGRRLTMPQFRILANIHHGFDRVGRIAEYHGVSQPSMSKMVDGLVRRGLIARTAHADDRRCISLKLTKKGEVLFQQVRREVKRRLQAKLTPLNPRARQELQRGLVQLSAIFDRST